MQRVTEHYRRAAQSLAGGVSSSTRVNRALGHPLYFRRAEGCRLWDLDDNEYIDLCCSHGAVLLGHGDERVKQAVLHAIHSGATCSYENELHAELAEQLCQMIPCVERVRYTGSGTEATMHCLRLARAYTGRAKLVRFEGNFHGYHDQVMFGAETPGQIAPALKPQSTGVTPGIDQHLIQIPYNRPDAVRDVFQQHGSEIAAAICEPVWYNAGCIVPDAEFMQVLREETQSHGALLVFDEVLSAFRMGPGGAQEYLGVTPDLCTLGKAVGGGYPISAFGGRADVMERLMPHGDCQHSGTYNGHTALVAASLAATKAYAEEGFYDPIHRISQMLCEGLTEIFEEHRVPGRVQGLGARFGVYFGIDHPVRNYSDAKKHDVDMMLRFIASAIKHGVYFHDYGGIACHHGFCAALSENDARQALTRLDRAVAELA